MSDAPETGLTETGLTETAYYQIKGRNKANRSAPAAPGQFRLGPALEVSPKPLVYTPYALDVKHRAVFEVGMPQVPSATPQAFFYLDQLDEAEVARRVPVEAYSPPDPAPAAPHRVLVFGIGRTGSTLVSKILDAAGIASISEPDILLNLSQRRMVDNLGLSPADWDRVYLASLAALETAHGRPGTLAIKFRAQSSNRFHIRRLLALMPGARFVFLFRGVEDWARSFTDKFEFDADTLKWLLTENLHAAALLRDAGADVTILRYEEIVQRPGIVLDGLIEPDARGDIDAALDKVMQVDSQQGMFDTAPPEGAARELAAFMGWWGENRPEAQLETLGLAL